MKTITIRGIDDHLNQALKAKAAKENQSLNQCVLQALKKMTGIDKKPLFTKHHDLDHLAGGWDADETKAFLEHTKIFEEIDKDVWV
jgi:hypothetical protein